jgi:nucleotide-binding universal stress UspA family protein
MFNTILWATDGSPYADDALAYAKELAASGRKLVAVHCKELLGGRAAGYPVRADETDLLEKMKRQVAELREVGIDASFVAFPASAGRAAHVIADYAREIGADVIVIGTRGHAALPALLVGSVTQRLLHLAPCPVFAVPPADHIPLEEHRLEEAGVA